MTWFVDPWSPSHGASFQADGAPSTRSDAGVDSDVELPVGAWTARPRPIGVREPDVVLLVDGVRRIDATLWTAEPDGDSYPGLAASYAAGVVRCDLRAGAAAVVGSAVRRGVFTGSPTAGPLVTAHGSYELHRTKKRELDQLPAAVQASLSALEIKVSAEVEQDADLLVVDGKLGGRDSAKTLGYVKTQQANYLNAAGTAVVAGLAPGERTPIFRIGDPWPSLSWYLRLPGPRGGPWAGIVRVECAASLPVPVAVGLADLSQVTLPLFASTAYKDPRAPQNLTPIAGLERRLRGLLGDGRLLHRAMSAAR
ncbi:hypothetical protein GCM10010123_05250 [Pilimelia anulata]|uniref:NurA domain-containing protein n=1 Tax=Pilimelia anulata TaxID=53371 RepID=A0A8J3B1X1_9ACTN|nr:hypothetical protein [Pilimelia anulata]GGJ78146.1 hypothetical protein GCM10010123_05250 [Pilimelia anulata]